MENKIKVVLFKIGEEPKEVMVENTVEGIQKAIGGGYFQTVRVNCENMLIICDEEGIIKNLPHNRGLRGDWLVVGSNGGDFASLDEKQIRWILNQKTILNCSDILRFRGCHDYGKEKDIA